MRPKENLAASWTSRQSKSCAEKVVSILEGQKYL